MKFIYLFLFFLISVSLYAQNVKRGGKAGSSPSDSAAKSKEYPPKALVVEEEQEEKMEVDKKEEFSVSSAKENQVMPHLSELEPLIPEVKKTEKKGIQVKVEKIVAGTGNAKHKGRGKGAVKVSSPWPDKPLNLPPFGWKYVLASQKIDPYRTVVKLGDGRSLKLSITPYVLVPVSDGRTIIRINEPGYFPAQGYSQKETMGSFLRSSTKEIEHQEKRAAGVIQQLQQLLSSLPQS